MAPIPAYDKSNFKTLKFLPYTAKRDMTMKFYTAIITLSPYKLKEFPLKIL